MNYEEETALLMSAEEGAKYDTSCKKIWSIKSIIAPVLKVVVQEFADCSVEEIMSLIDEASTAVSDTVADIRVPEQKTESKGWTEKTVFFDIRFNAKNPKLSSRDACVLLNFDYEMQNNYRMSYPVVTRGIYYVARMISEQLGTVTKTTDYAKLQKVYSIWVCRENIPEELQNTVTRYAFQREDLIGVCQEPEAAFDLMEIIVIRRGDRETDDDDVLFEYLNAVDRADFETIERYTKLTPDEQKEVCSMGGMGMSIAITNYRKGVEDGIKQGAKEHAIQTFKNCIARGISRESAQAVSELTDEEIEEYGL